jgi:hypothetical protein
MEIFTGLFWLAFITALLLLLYHPVKIAVREYYVKERNRKMEVIKRTIIFLQ